MSTNVISIARPLKLTTIKEINGAWTANMQIRPDDYIAAETYVDIDSEEYITKVLKRVKTKGKTFFDITLFHNMSELADLTIDRFTLTKSVTNILTHILTGSGWTAGTCDIDEIVVVSLDRRTSILEALNLLAFRSGGELYFYSKTKVVDLKREVGSDTGLHLRYDKNCDYIEKEEDSTDLVTRIYPYGADNFTLNTTTLDNCEDETLYTGSGSATLASSDYKQNGSQGIEMTFTALNETVTRDLGAGGVIDLTGHDTVKFWIYAEDDIAAGFTFGIGEAAYTENTVNTGALTGGCWHEISLDLSGVAAGDKNAIRYIGFKNLTNGAAVASFDMIRGFDGDIYIDSANRTLYAVNKEYTYHHSAKAENTQFEAIIYPTDDAYVHQNSPTTNYGSKTYLEARNHSSTPDYLSFMKFATSSIPTGATILAATLYLDVYFLGANGSGIGVTTAVYECAADFDEDTVTYNTMPGQGASMGSINMTSTGWKTLDITTEFNAWYGGGTNYGMRFDVTAANDDYLSAWYSKDNLTDKPYVLVTYTLPTDPSSVIDAAARAYLDDHDEPKLKYKVNVADLSKVMVDTWEDESIGLGDTVKIYDAELGLNVSVRIKKIVKDLLEPGNIRLELVNKTYTVTDIEAKRAKQLSYAMPFEDNPNIVNANSIQTGYLGSDVNV